MLGARLNFTTIPTIVGSSENPTTATPIRAAHITQLRSAINAVRSLAALSAATWTNSNLAVGDHISKDDVNELRTKLDDALTTLALRPPTYIDQPLLGAPNGTLVRAVQIRQLRECSTGGSSCYKPIRKFVEDFYLGLNLTPTENELNDWSAVLGQAQAQGASQLLAAAQSLGSTLFNSAAYTNQNRTNEQFVADLYKGYLQRTHDLGGYNFWLNELNNNGDTRAHQIQAFAASSEFGGNVTALCTAPSIGGGLRYVLADVQGSSRAVMNNNGAGTSSIIARHDYLPFGEEIGSGLGLRNPSQGYNAIDNSRQKFALTERDSVTGLDHTWFRKYENLSGRWTSPDPVKGTIENPQAFNRYTYVNNDPVNLVDPVVCIG